MLFFSLGGLYPGRCVVKWPGNPCSGSCDTRTLSTMSDIATLVQQLDNFSFTSVDRASTNKVIKGALNFLAKAECHSASILPSSPPLSPTSHEENYMITSSTSELQQQPKVHSVPQEQPKVHLGPQKQPGAHSAPWPQPIVPNVDYQENILEPGLLADITKVLHTLQFVPMSSHKNSPDIALFGDTPHILNNATKQLTPKLIRDGSTLSRVLDTVNCKLGTAFNSILVNKYNNKNIYLEWHQDNEEDIDESSPIATLSVGYPRRFQISHHKQDRHGTQNIEIIVRNNSVLIMKPGLRKEYYPRVCAGRKTEKYRKGMRYSLTFRRLLNIPSPPFALSTPSYPVIDKATSTTPNAHTSTTPNAHTNCKNTLLFGCSLARELDSDLLSKRGKTFKVFFKGGAKVGTIIHMVNDAVDKKEVCTCCVETIFLVAGGIDVAGITSSSGLDKLKESYNKLIQLINSRFPAIRINIVSLIPRRCKDCQHLQHMLLINDYLANLCENVMSNCYFIKMFSKYLVHKSLYHSKQEVYLNEILFRRDKIHFSSVGIRVLAKSLIAVANNPYY